MSFPAGGSTARAACSRETTPSRLGSFSSANMTGVWNCSASSLMVASPTSTGTMLPTAVSEGGDLSTGIPHPDEHRSGYCGVGGAGVDDDVEFFELVALEVADLNGYCYGSQDFLWWFGAVCPACVFHASGQAYYLSTDLGIITTA